MLLDHSLKLRSSHLPQESSLLASRTSSLLASLFKMSVLYSLLSSKLRPPRNPTCSFAGQTVVVTGANRGLGFEAALKFVYLGASLVVLACRNPSKGEEAKRRIENRTGRKNVCEVMQLDLDSFQSIRDFMKRLSKEVQKLDVALLNAGVVQPKHRLSKEGWEETLQVNLLGTTFLAMLLLPYLEESVGAPLGRLKHLCFVTSANYASASLPAQAMDSPNMLEYVNKEEHFGGLVTQYNISKLFLMCVAGRFAALVKNDAKGVPCVVINSVNPGVTATKLTRNITRSIEWTVAFVYINVVSRTAEEGSRSLVSACSQGRESHGQLWQDDAIQT